MRLDKLLANAGLGSRKDVRKLIRKGAISVNGDRLNDPAAHIATEDFQTITINGRPLTLQHTVHLILYKPAGYITATKDSSLPHVLQLIEDDWMYADLFPVGRLDRDTTGLLLLTNDGQLGHRLTSPKWDVAKEYLVVTQGKPFNTEDVATFAAGIKLDDGLCKPALLKPQGDHAARLTITEGKYHQVKRMMSATGREVVNLTRTRFGPLDLTGLPEPGYYRLLDHSEVIPLYNLVQLDPPEI
ncbi:MAG: pseudouridine synthase [Fastidiosipilaceae bacterium]|jgi:16S rRNA pseudouridine516 synthase|nr:rRNA pseudouridine synthase [Clostridiaceae bacterium]